MYIGDLLFNWCIDLKKEVRAIIGLKRCARFIPGISLILLSGIGMAHAGGQARAVSQSGMYSLDFSQFAFGGVSSESPLYSMEDSIRYASSDQETQISPRYTVTNPLDRFLQANNGIAIGQGTVVKVEWTEDDLPANFAGYNVYRGVDFFRQKAKWELRGESLILLNDSLLTEPYFIDLTPSEQTFYFYQINMVDQNSAEYLWIPRIEQYVRIGLPSIRNHLLGIEELEMEKLIDADYNEDSEIDSADIIFVLNPDNEEHLRFYP